jgi:hypothetical protein
MRRRFTCIDAKKDINVITEVLIYTVHRSNPLAVYDVGVALAPRSPRCPSAVASHFASQREAERTSLAHESEGA